MISSAKIAYRPDIQGLRALAVLVVMIFHWDYSLLPSGFIGVDVFFVISGYLMTAILLNRKDSVSFIAQLKQFYISRLKRIVPVYYFVLILAVVLFSVILIQQDFAFFKDSVVSAIQFTSNNYFAHFGDYFAPASDELPLLHTWSLAVEMQFYLFYPFVILLIPRKYLFAVFVSAIIIFVLVSEYYAYLGNKQMVYYSTLARVPEFLLGSLAFLSLPYFQSLRKKSFILGLSLLLFGLFFIHSELQFLELMVLLPVFGAVLILASNYGKNVLLTNRPFIFIGNISYSLYLWHWVILAFIRYVTGDYQLSVLFSIIYWVLSFILAIFSYYFIERYFLLRAATVQNKAFAWSTILCSLILIIFSAKDINAHIIKPMPVELTRYADANKVCHSHIVGDCTVGNKNDSVSQTQMRGGVSFWF